MHVTFAAADQDLAKRVTKAILPLCDELARRTEQDTCRLQLAPGVVVADLWAKDGTGARVPLGIRPLAALLSTNNRDGLRGLVDLLMRKARLQQEAARATRPLLLH